MGCGCGGRAAPTIPVTSGDLAAADDAAPRFKVVRDEIDPETGTNKVDYFPTHRAASIGRADGGGKIRVV